MVTGKGVVGFCPTLTGTGGCFQYMSNVPLTTASGRMGGFFTFKRQANTPLDVPIPAFELKPLPEDVPSAPAPTAWAFVRGVSASGPPCAGVFIIRRVGESPRDLETTRVQGAWVGA